MVAILMLTLAVAAQNSAERHVRASEPRILALVETGLRRSETFRRLVDALNASDLIVYIEPKRTRQEIGGYLAHNIVVTSSGRYVRVSIQTHGSEYRLVALLAHELQHAVELAQHPDVRNPEAVVHMFEHIASPFGCDSKNCSETDAAIEVENTVKNELMADR